MPWTQFYNQFFNQWTAPQNLTQIDATKTARRYSCVTAPADIWLGFSGVGAYAPRAVKVEWYANNVRNLGGAVQRAHILKQSLIEAGVSFQSGHNNRHRASQATGGSTAFIPLNTHDLVRTNNKGFLNAPCAQPLGTCPVLNEVGIEHAGKAGRVVVWMPNPIRADQTGATTARAWINSVLPHFC